MDKPSDQLGAEMRAAEETLSRTELQIEQEKLKLERERILLERERLEAMRNRTRAAEGLRTDKYGKLSVTLSTLILVSIICTLVGGILGAFSTSMHLDRQNSARLQEVVQTLASSSPELVEITTNQTAAGGSEMPPWLKAMKPKVNHSGIALVVIK